MRNLIVFSLLFMLAFAGIAQQTFETDVTFLRAKDHITYGDYQKAVKEFDQVIIDFGDQAEVFALRGKAKLYSGDKDGAIKDLEKAIALDPQSRNVQYTSAEMKGTMGDMQGALASLNTLLTAHPDDSDALMIRASYLKIRGLDQKACADWHKAKSLGNKTAEGFINRMCK